MGFDPPKQREDCYQSNYLQATTKKIMLMWLNHFIPCQIEINIERQYSVVSVRIIQLGLKWRWFDGQVGPCMGQCMGGV